MRAIWEAPVEAQSQRCVFSVEPRTPYAWDERCNDPALDHLGCRADGEHQELCLCLQVSIGRCLSFRNLRVAGRGRQ